MRSCLELSRNQTMGTSSPEKSLSVNLICGIADQASSIQPIRRRSVPGGSQDSFAEFRLTNYAGALGNPRPAMDYLLGRLTCDTHPTMRESGSVRTARTKSLHVQRVAR
jgi:hypothetical protein